MVQASWCPRRRAGTAYGSAGEATKRARWGSGATGHSPTSTNRSVDDRPIDLGTSGGTSVTTCIDSEVRIEVTPVLINLEPDGSPHGRGVEYEEVAASGQSHIPDPSNLLSRWIDVQLGDGSDAHRPDFVVSVARFGKKPGGETHRYKMSPLIASPDVSAPWYASNPNGAHVTQPPVDAAKLHQVHRRR